MIIVSFTQAFPDTVTANISIYSMQYELEYRWWFSLLESSAANPMSKWKKQEREISMNVFCQYLSALSDIRATELTLGCAL